MDKNSKAAHGFPLRAVRATALLVHFPGCTGKSPARRLSMIQINAVALLPPNDAAWHLIRSSFGSFPSSKRWHCHGYYERAADRWHRICHFGSGAISAASEERDMVEATMGNARFFRRNGPHPLAVVTDTARGTADDLELLLEGVAPLQTAGPKEVSFLDNPRYASALDQTLAGAVIVHPDMAARSAVGPDFGRSLRR